MLDALTLAPLFAQVAPAGGGFSQILFMVAAFGGIVYFLIWRPQQQQRKKHEEMVGGLKRGDKVIMQGGLYGKVTHVGEETLNVEIASGVVVEQVKSMIMSVDAKPEPQSAKKEPAAKKAPAKRATANKTPAKKAPAKKPAAKKPTAKK